MSDLRRVRASGVVALLAVVSALGSVGCAAPGVSGANSALDLERQRTHAAQQRVAELEARLLKVEQQARAAERAETKAAMVKLDRLLAVQQRLVEAVARVPEVVAVHQPPPADQVCRPATAQAASFEARLQDLFERMHDDSPPWRGGLSREKREALRILLREDRKLDGANPLEL
jgi:hypothetical protein